MAIEKLKITADSKIKLGPINKLKPYEQPWTQTNQTTYMTQKLRTQVFKFLTPLTLSVKKTVNLQGFMEVYQPRNINVLFSQCGS
jgi:hypothetical protein